MKVLISICVLIGGCARDGPQQDAVVPPDSAALPTTAAVDSVMRGSAEWYQRWVGVGSRARDGSECLTIANAGLSAGAPVLLVSARTPQRVDTARIAERRSSPCTEPGDEIGDALIDSAAYYNLQLNRPVPFGGPTIGILAPVRLLAADSVVTSDLDADGQPERFQSCTSSEGIHLSILTAEMVRWHAYYYVPYDLEPSCPGSGFENNPTGG